ncbi:MAG: motility associated factor glycosyltransferase family protein [Desulfobacteraceae bacterium]|nr:motility associated factor glycosyltransferase family protein [Desulfobacteraceae bacterium]
MSTSIPSPVRRIARSFLGDRWYRALGALYSRWREDKEGRKDPRYRTSIGRIVAMKDKHQGERCFIIGNGPSLRNTDLSLLKGEVTFGMNRIYLLFDQVGFATTYYVAVNKLVIEQCAREIASLTCPKFISWHARDEIDFTTDMMFLHSRWDNATFYTDITKGIWEGATVTYVAMQIAYYLGFHKVILIGVDHSYATQGKPHTTVVSQGGDPNHFDPKYFGKGFRWQLPDLETSELAYRIAKYQFESKDREIVDATIDGKLQVFSKVDYGTLFK